MTDMSHSVMQLNIASPYRVTQWLLLAVSPQVGLINPDIIHFHGRSSHSLLLVTRGRSQGERGREQRGGRVNSVASHRAKAFPAPTKRSRSQLFISLFFLGLSKEPVSLQQL